MISEKDIVYITPDFLVVNKPCGLSVQTEANAPGCVDLLKRCLGESALHPVHRLDKVTSGLLLIARHSKANQILSLLFQHRNVEKYYIALSHKRPQKKQGAVIGDMSKARNGCWKLHREKLSPAITQFYSFGLGGGVRLFALKPYTGKTHQIRVALKSLGSPILGDTAYGGASADRVYLHAATLRFTYGNKVHYVAARPNIGEWFVQEDFDAFWQQLPPLEKLQWPQIKK